MTLLNASKIILKNCMFYSFKTAKETNSLINYVFKQKKTKRKPIFKGEINDPEPILYKDYPTEPALGDENARFDLT